MLTQAKSRWARLRYAGLIPVFGALLLVFACEAETDSTAEMRTEAIMDETNAIALQSKKVNGEADPEIETYVPVDEAPQVLNMRDIQKQIGYPQIARDAGIEGNVVARILVSTSGEYLQHEIITNPHDILSRQVEEHLPDLVFTPAMVDGKPAQYWVNLPFNFKLLP